MRSIWLVLGIWASTCTPAGSAEPGIDCTPVLKAMAKTLQTDHSAITQSGGRTSTGITAGGVDYLQIGGAWKVSPLSPQDNQKRSDENLRNAKTYTCQALPDSMIDGVTAANYRTRTESDDAVVDSTVSIAKRTGLALRVENDTDTGGGNRRHYITKYSYTGIQAPAAQK